MSSLCAIALQLDLRENISQVEVGRDKQKRVKTGHQRKVDEVC